MANTITHPTWGFDQYGPVTAAQMRAITASGLGFAGGYLSSTNKGMTSNSSSLLCGAGMYILSYYEGNGQTFSTEQAKADAAAAVAGAQRCGQPKGSRIFFACDFNPSQGTIASNIVPHFEQLNKELAGEYGVDAYGSGLVLEDLLAASLITYSVLGAIGWRDGQKFLTKASVVQKPPSDPYHFGYQVDPLFAQIGPANWGWMLGTTPAPQPLPPHPVITPAWLYSAPLQVGSQGDAVRVLQAMLGVAVDGIYGAETEAAAVKYRAANNLPPGTPLRLEMVGGS